MGSPRKFTCTIFCSNCHNVGEYEFRKGTVLHSNRRFRGSEYRNMTPQSDGYEDTIRQGQKYDGKLVHCKFCNVSTALHIQRRESQPLPVPTKVSITPSHEVLQEQCCAHWPHPLTEPCEDAGQPTPQ